jgi:hypothetical protein
LTGLIVGASGCGDDSATDGGGGEGGSGPAGPVTTSTTMSTPTSTSTGSGACTAITPVLDQVLGEYYWSGLLMPSIGGGSEDFLDLLLPEGATGSMTLALPANAAECGATAACVILYEDYDPDAGAAAIYLASGGTLDLGATTGPFYIAGSMSNLNLVEVEVDDMGGITQTAGGACYSAANVAFMFEPPVSGWTCNPDYYGDMAGCDCDCGALDTDCMDPMQEIYNCQEGQTCSAAGECEGIPTGWTCAPGEFDGGAGNGCDCNCGAIDPDCELPGEAVQNCGGGETCNGNGVCLSPSWTCDPDYFGDEFFCDCGCGVVDSDCMDATVGSCDFCANTGSCSAQDCPGTINPTNNAVCN